MVNVRGLAAAERVRDRSGRVRGPARRAQRVVRSHPPPCRRRRSRIRCARRRGRDRRPRRDGRAATGQGRILANDARPHAADTGRGDSVARARAARRLGGHRPGRRRSGDRTSAQQAFVPAWNIVGSAYFSTLRIPVLEGRDFASNDTAGAPAVVIVSEAVARRLWPGQSAIGMSLRLPPVNASEGRTEQRLATVIGVVADIRSSSLIDGLAEPYVYLALAQSEDMGMIGQMSIVARGRGATRLAPLIATVVQQVDQRMVLAHTESLADAIALGLTPQRVLATISGVMGLVALLLTSMGLYGVTAYAVTLRRREFAIRLALGAPRARVVRMVCRQSTVLVAAGCALASRSASACCRSSHVLLRPAGGRWPHHHWHGDALWLPSARQRRSCRRVRPFARVGVARFTRTEGEPRSAASATARCCHRYARSARSLVVEPVSRTGASRPARSAGFESRHSLRDKQPQPMHEVRLSRSRWSSAMRSSTCRVHPLEMRAQSERSGVRLAGSSCEFSANLRQRQPDPLREHDEAEPAQDRARIPAMGRARALGPDQPSLFVEAQRGGGHAAATGHFRDREQVSHGRRCKKSA